MSGILKGWGRYFKKETPPESKKLEFPKDFFLSPEQVEHKASELEKCSLIENLAITEGLMLSRQYGNIRGNSYKEYPSIRWTKGLLIFHLGGQVIEDTADKQVSKLLRLEKEGYDIPSAYQKLIVNTTGSSYVGKYYKKNIENTGSILKVTRFSGVKNTSPSFHVEIYPNNSYVVREETTYTFQELTEFIKEGQLIELVNKELSHWINRVKSYDKTRDKMKYILSLFLENEEYEEMFADIHKKVITFSTGDRVVPHQWIISKRNGKEIIRIFYHLITDRETKVINIDMENCIKYPKFINLLHDVVKHFEEEKKIAFFIKTFGNSFEKEYILKFMPGTEITVDGIVCDTVSAYPDGHLKVFQSTTFSIVPLDRIELKRLLDNVLVRGNEIINTLLNKEEKQFPEELTSDIEKSKDYISENLQYFSNSDNTDISLEDLWQKIYADSKVNPEVIELATKATLSSLVEDSGASLSGKSNGSENKTKEENGNNNSGNESPSSDAVSPDSENKENDITPPEKESSDSEESDTTIDYESQNIFTSERKISSTGITPSFNNEKRDSETLSDESNKEEETSPAVTSPDSEYRQVEEVESGWRNNNLNAKKQETLLFYGKLISEKLSRQLEDSQLPWVDRKDGLPCNINGKVFEGAAAIILSLWKESENFKTNIYLLSSEIKENDLLVRYDARPMFLLKNGTLQKVYNIEQTNCFVENKRLYNQLVSSITATNASVKIKYGALEKASVANGRTLCVNGEVNLPKYIHAKKEIVIAEKGKYEDVDDYYRDLGIVTTEAIREVDIASLPLNSMITEDLIALLGSAMISQDCRFNATNSSYISLWIKWLNESPDFVEQLLTCSEKAFQKAIKE